MLPGIDAKARGEYSMRGRLLGTLAFLFFAGCATPVEIKQATTLLDEAYGENIALVGKYRDTVESINQLHQSWARYIKTRLLLGIAISSSTTDPSSAAAAGTLNGLLGADILAWVNAHRLNGLSAQGPLVAGSSRMSTLVEGLPSLVSLVQKQVDGTIAANEKFADLTPFDVYAKKAMVLKKANLAVRDYLDVDVTVSKEDVQSIAEAIHQLGKKQ
jgi:hypothetical protein